MSNKSENKRNQECNCDQANLHLHVEIENLKQRLLERERHIVKMETNFLKEAEKFPNGEFAAVMEQLLTWQEKYSRLYESHKRVQRVNQGLEDKLLKIVDKCETEKNVLSGEITSLTKKQIEQQMYNIKLQEENERYRNDLSIAIQLLQCKPSNFVPQKFDMLPPDFQMKVKSHMANKQRKLSDGSNGVTPKPEIKTIKVPIPTFPPTAMVYSLDRDKDTNLPGAGSTDNKPTSQVDIVSAAIMAKILEEREKERLNAKHCQTCCCAAQSNQTQSKSVQTYDACCSSSNYSPTKNSCGRRLPPNADNYDPVNCNADAISSSTTSSGGTTDSSGKDSNSANIDLIDLSDNYYYYCYNNNNNNSNNSSDDNNKTDGIVRDDCSKADSTIKQRQRGLESAVGLSSLMDAQNSPSEMYKGPRLCSVRLQMDSNNILLDNAAQFSAPILYKRRQSQDNNGSSEPMVHHVKINTTTTSGAAAAANGTNNIIGNATTNLMSFNNINDRFCAETRI